MTARQFRPASPVRPVSPIVRPRSVEWNVGLRAVVITGR
ncbi:Uncharacterised protein [Mycobacteroides abscessus subsp. abscessus]|nr:Uncharacterised protein [Mycobacteroides abscessus subsp. abscessus]